jgi:hypothetical protein
VGGTDAVEFRDRSLLFGEFESTPCDGERVAKVVAEDAGELFEAVVLPFEVRGGAL